MCIDLCTEAGEASLGGLELLSARWNAMLNCCWVQVKLAVELVSIAGVCEYTCVHNADVQCLELHDPLAP